MFKSKKLLCLVLSLLLLICFTIPVYASESAGKVIRLTPDVQTEKVLDDVKLIFNSDNTVTLTVTEHKEKNAGLESYTINIDKDNKTYKATRVTGKDLEKITEKIQKNSPSSTLGLYSTLGSYSIRVAATTFDPPGYVICQTYNELYWSTSGNTCTLNSRYEGSYAANPSPPGTHWYCNGLYWTGLYQGGDLGYLTSTNRADYYNYDWGFPGIATYITHDVSCTGYSTGASSYSASCTRSGEDYWLLSFNYTTY